jgi:hypothetical protein
MVTQASPFEHQPFNRNELASYGLLVILASFAALLLGISRWYATPGPQLVVVGHQLAQSWLISGVLWWRHSRPLPSAVLLHGRVMLRLYSMSRRPRMA